ncbi:hypothetical protein BDV95DRAFT_584495 [Massariosphaeria phaeospora]|uniref:Uncharacterized protein n=1 Tax=Massariosphaeria phaeospora TaxID=100035 RepID=A0A7C8HZI7_9PLEO|nr:hypothetical protein BDV95DRAFT_584495 [Massariosphaeria phaeospora]
MCDDLRAKSARYRAKYLDQALNFHGPELPRFCDARCKIFAKVLDEIIETFYEHYKDFEIYSPTYIPDLLKQNYFNVGMTLSQAMIRVFNVTIDIRESTPRVLGTRESTLETLDTGEPDWEVGKLHEYLAPLVQAWARPNFRLDIVLESGKHDYESDDFAERIVDTIRVLRTIMRDVEADGGVTTLIFALVVRDP